MSARETCNSISVVLSGFRFRAARHTSACSYLMQLLLIRMRYIGGEIKPKHQPQPSHQSLIFKPTPVPTPSTYLSCIEDEGVSCPPICQQRPGAVLFCTEQR